MLVGLKEPRLKLQRRIQDFPWERGGVGRRASYGGRLPMWPGFEKKKCMSKRKNWTCKGGVDGAPPGSPTADVIDLFLYHFLYF